MTMPDKVYAGHNGYGTYWQTNASDTDTTYLRADIADELARALEVAQETATAQYKGNLYPENADGWEMCVNDMLGCIEDALARYRTLTP